MKKIGRWTIDDKGWGWFFLVVVLVWFLVVVPFILVPCFVVFWAYERVTGRKC